MGAKLKAAGKATAANMAAIIPPMVHREDLADAVGYVENAGAPTSVVPEFVGQRLFDTTNSEWYVATGTSAGNWRLSSAGLEVPPTGTPASYATAGNVTYTAADLISGVIVRDCAGAGRSDTLPTAALLVAAIPGCQVGDIVDTLIVNGSDAAETITLGAGSGGAFDTNQTAASRIIGQNTSKRIRVRLTNVGSGTEAYVVYA
jgi:hypothetical protein